MLFIETSHFTKWIDSLLDDDSYAALQVFLGEHPEAGNVIRGTGGLHKIRWAPTGRGKSGGVRVIYYWQVEGDRIYMLTIYGKNVKDNLTAAERSAWRKVVEAIKNG